MAGKTRNAAGAKKNAAAKRAAKVKSPQLPPGDSMGLEQEQLDAMLALLPEADSVELKLTVPDVSHRATLAALDMDVLDAQIRQVFFFDTPDLTLYKGGVVVRARRIQGKGGDSVVKLRPVVPHELPLAVRRSKAFGIEIDAMPGGFVCSGSLKAVSDVGEIRQAAHGERALRKVFTKEQRALFAAHAPEGLALDDLSVLGPVFVLKLPFTPPELDRKLVTEMWLYPDGSRILELSTKCAPSEMGAILAQARQFLDQRGVDRGGDQAAKTKKALEFFAAELVAARDAAAD